MDEFKKGWFSEVSESEWPGQAQSLEVEEILHKEKSQFQEILIFKRYQLRHLKPPRLILAAST